MHETMQFSVHICTKSTSTHSHIRFKLTYKSEYHFTFTKKSELTNISGNVLFGF